MARRAKRNYVNNRDFLDALIQYKSDCAEAEAAGDELPRVPDYIGTCIYQIATRLATKPNFSGYTYKDDMISDGIENCLLYINNFNPEKSQNPFAYFTQIIWYAFLRRITKEKKQQEIKEKYLAQSGIDAFLVTELGTDDASSQVANHFIDTLKDRIDKVKAYDTEIKTFSKNTKTRKKRAVNVDSDLSNFLE